MCPLSALGPHWAQQHRTRGCAHLLGFTELSEGSGLPAAGEWALVEVTKRFSWRGHSAERKSTGVTKQMSCGSAGHSKYLCLTLPSSAQKAGEQRYDMSYEGSCRTDFCKLWHSASHQERCDRAHASSHRGGDVSSFSLRNNNVT